MSRNPELMGKRQSGAYRAERRTAGIILALAGLLPLAACTAGSPNQAPATATSVSPPGAACGKENTVPGYGAAYALPAYLVPQLLGRDGRDIQELKWSAVKTDISQLLADQHPVQPLHYAVRAEFGYNDASPEAALQNAVTMGRLAAEHLGLPLSSDPSKIYNAGTDNVGQLDVYACVAQLAAVPSPVK